MYTIYKHTFPNGKVYIGCTAVRPEFRYGTGGKGYFDCVKMREAIQKYGWSNVEHEVLATTCDREQAVALELSYIDEYQATNPSRGYNTYHRGLSHSIGAVPSDIGKRISNGKRGARGMHKEGEYNFVTLAEAEKLLSMGWEYGGKPLSEHQKQNISAANKGRICMYSGTTYRTVPADKVDELVAKGWLFGGKPITEERKRHLREINTGKIVSLATKQKLITTNTGMTYLHKGELCTKAKGELLQQLLAEGWEPGVPESVKEANRQGQLGKTQSAATRQKRAESMRGVHSGKKQINKDGVRKLVSVQELDDYLADGWFLGVGSRKPAVRNE